MSDENTNIQMSNESSNISEIPTTNLDIDMNINNDQATTRGGLLKVPKSKEYMIANFLRHAAVADASHDFSDKRSIEQGFNFNTYFNSGHKHIGTPEPILPTENDSIYNGFQIMNLLFNCGNDYQSFKEKLLTGGPGEEPMIGYFYRWTNDTPYTITSCHVANKNGQGDYEWHLTSERMYQFLNPHKQDTIAFSIDAINVPFQECLLKDGGDSSLEALYIQPREGINDAASKVMFDSIRTQKQNIAPLVNITPVYDTYGENIVYPAILLQTNPNIPDLEFFFSNYNLILSPISNASNIESILLMFDLPNSDHEKTIIVKTQGEDVHPNAVPVLANYLSKMIATNNQIEYETSLQQKRSGDWLQSLALMDPTRYNVSETIRPFLATHDKLCLAFGLMCGIDMVFTSVDPATGKYSLIRFHKNTRSIPLTQEQTLEAEIQFLKATTPEIETKYDTLKTKYLELWSTKFAVLSKKLVEIREKFENQKEVLQNKGNLQYSSFIILLKEVLLSYAEMGSFLSITPALVKQDDSLFKNLNLNITIRKQSFEHYKKNRVLLFSFGDAKYRDNFEKMYRNERTKVGHRLKNFTILEKNGDLGILVYLNTTLPKSQKKELRLLLEKGKNILSSSKKKIDTKLIHSYQTFLEIVDIHIHKPIRYGPTLEEYSNADLIEMADSVSSFAGMKRRRNTTNSQRLSVKKLKTQLGGTLGANTRKNSVNRLNYTDTSNIQITDYSVAIPILARRAQVDLVEKTKRLHNPLTTFYFLFRYLGYLYTLEEYGHYTNEISKAVVTLDYLIKQSFQLNMSETIVSLQGLETLLIDSEKGTEYLPSSLSNDFMLRTMGSVLKTFFGFDMRPSVEQHFYKNKIAELTNMKEITLNEILEKMNQIKGSIRLIDAYWIHSDLAKFTTERKERDVSKPSSKQILNRFRNTKKHGIYTFANIRKNTITKNINKNIYKSIVYIPSTLGKTRGGKRTRKQIHT